ncbi:hypothetical protein V2J09_011986, partial [Rumex salicifolius]
FLPYIVVRKIRVFSFKIYIFLFFSVFYLITNIFTLILKLNNKSLKIKKIYSKLKKSKIEVQDYILGPKPIEEAQSSIYVFTCDFELLRRRLRVRRKRATEMGKPWMLLVVGIGALSLLAASSAYESPEYEVVHVESEFEVRLYKESVWMTASVNNIDSFHLATKVGFHRLFQYIKGANLNWTYIPMTKPILTSVTPGSNSPLFTVHFYLPTRIQASPPVPLDELHLQNVSLPSHCVAVRKFSGFARDTNIVREAQKLVSSLSKSTQWANSTSLDSKYAYSIAQYDSPIRFVQRLNEVWIDVVGSSSGACGEFSGIAAY